MSVFNCFCTKASVDFGTLSLDPKTKALLPASELQAVFKSKGIDPFKPIISSCGTGVTAAALVCYHNDNGFNRVEIKTLGGHLSVDYDKFGDQYQNIWLNGTAKRVFEGTIEL